MRDRDVGARSTLELLTLAFGVVFLLVGVLGFIPGITSDFDDLSFAGEDSTSELLGIFQVSILHNIVHILFGLVGIWAARAWDSARLYMIGGGIIYLALFLLGIIGGLDWLPANTADHWLHVALGVVMVGIGYVFGRDRAATATV
jgi:heme/copper-type cytochrome/quinol oxidase subunit 3